MIHLETLKSALNLAIENEKNVLNKDIQILELLLKQIKFEYTVDSSKNKLKKRLDLFFIL